MYAQDRYVYSFFHNHKIFSTKDNREYDKEYEAKSKFFGRDFLSVRGAKAIDNEIKSPRYFNLVYDKYRNIFYRFCYTGYNITKDDSSLELMMYLPIFSIIVLDKDLNVIGETLFPENTYNPYMYFVAPEGLYISTNHIKNPDFDEDYLKFDLFELKEM